MTDKATHTPLPWKVADGADQYICNGDHWIASTMGIRGEEGAANAAFIVHAVNSHHDLIEALREIGELTERRQLPLTNQINDIVLNALRAKEAGDV